MYPPDGSVLQAVSETGHITDSSSFYLAAPAAALYGIDPLGSTRKLVFWYDDNGDLVDDIDQLALKNAKVHRYRQKTLHLISL